jgi:glycosyltransferase involved in cell wall biosynthesis
VTHPHHERISVIIPARNEAGRIRAAVEAAFAAGSAAGADVEMIVVDDGSADDTASEASDAGARVLRITGSGNPGAARNRGAAAASGSVLVFLDADCVPVPQWLEALLAAHRAGERCVGGSLALPRGLPVTARWDYYFSSYHLHPGLPAGPVPNHTPANLSVLRSAFEATPGFSEEPPVADGHEELAWQGALAAAGHRCYFEPRAVVYHHNRPGLRNMMRRTYRWAYSSVQAKAESGVARWPWLYRHPLLLAVASLATAPFQAVYILGCWRRGRSWEPLLAFPVLLAARVVYAVGMSVGGLRWLRQSGSGTRAVASESA